MVLVGAERRGWKWEKSVILLTIKKIYKLKRKKWYTFRTIR